MKASDRALWLAEQAKGRELERANPLRYNWDITLHDRAFLLHVNPRQNRAAVQRLYPSAGISPAAKFCGEP